MVHFSLLKRYFTARELIINRLNAFAGRVLRIKCDGRNNFHWRTSLISVAVKSYKLHGMTLK